MSLPSLLLQVEASVINLQIYIRYRSVYVGTGVQVALHYYGCASLVMSSPAGPY